MRSEWQKAQLNEVVIEVIDHRGQTPKKLGGDFCSSGVRVISAKNIKDGRIDYNSEMRYISREIYERWMPVKLRYGDVLLTSEAPLGETAYVKNDTEFCLGQRLFALRANKQKIDPRYLYYYLRSSKGQHELHARATGTTAQGIRQSELLKIRIEYPRDIREQRAIAHILGTLDDKIELNRRMNETLEAIARAIFKSWFVDFDPVIDNALKADKPIPDELEEKAARRREILARAQAEGRPAGLPEHLARLFPDEFEESELGWIPKGWKVVVLGDVMEILDSWRVPLSSRQRAKRQGPYPYYGAAGILDYVDDYLFEGVHVLLGEDGSVVDDNGHPFVQYVWGRFWVNNHAHVLKGKNGICNEHLYLFLKHINIQPFVTGAVQPKLNQQNMKAIPFLLPSMPVCNIFSQNVAQVFERLRVNTDQAKTLAAIRDTLLPKLISGEIRIKDVNKFLGGNV